MCWLSCLPWLNASSSSFLFCLYRVGCPGCPPKQERLETLSLEAAEAAGSAANLSVKVQRLEASLKQDKSKRAVLRQTFKAKMAAATRESDILKGALRAANVPIPDLTPLPSTEEDEKKKGAGEGEAEEDEVDDEEVSAAEMVLLLRQEVAHLKKELEVANAKVANAAAAQSGAVVDEEEEEEEEEEVIALKDDPKFAKYFKMLAMHLPKPVCTPTLFDAFIELFVCILMLFCWYNISPFSVWHASNTHSNCVCTCARILVSRRWK